MSQRIERIEWGIIEVGGRTFKDAKLFPGGASEWDWNQTGTRHSPGIQISDVEELLQKGATHLVLSRGMQLVLQTKPETLEFLAQQRIGVDVLETREAVARYHQLLQEGVPVGALLHSTC